MHLGAEAGSFAVFNVTSNIEWTVSDDADWLTVSPAEHSGDGTVTVTAINGNTTGAERTAAVTVFGSGITRTVNITQDFI